MLRAINAPVVLEVVGACTIVADAIRRRFDGNVLLLVIVIAGSAKAQ